MFSIAELMFSTQPSIFFRGPSRLSVRLLHCPSLPFPHASPPFPSPVLNFSAFSRIISGYFSVFAVSSCLVFVQHFRCQPLSIALLAPAEPNAPSYRHLIGCLYWRRARFPLRCLFAPPNNLLPARLLPTVCLRRCDYFVLPPNLFALPSPALLPTSHRVAFPLSPHTFLTLDTKTRTIFPTI